jgi:hypothetical protein
MDYPKVERASIELLIAALTPQSPKKLDKKRTARINRARDQAMERFA